MPRIRHEVVAAVCASGLLPFGIDAFKEAIRLFLPARLQEANLRALEYGREHFVNAQDPQRTFDAGPLAGHMLAWPRNSPVSPFREEFAAMIFPCYR